MPARPALSSRWKIALASPRQRFADLDPPSLDHVGQISCPQRHRRMAAGLRHRETAFLAWLRRLSPNSSPQPTMAAASSPWMPIQSPACPRHRGLVCANSTDHTKVGPEHTKALAQGNTLATLAVRASQADEIHALPLSNELRDHLFELHCPTCSHPTSRKGSWVITVQFRMR